MDYTVVTAEEFAALEGLDDWSYDAGVISASYELDSFPKGALLVGAIAAAAEAVVHHPDLTLDYPGRVGIRLTTHGAGDLTTLDTDLAHTITAIATALGA
jgi:4a-hydroxytetrahydrobiopterin dehydratase